MGIKAALLDEHGLYLRIDDLEDHSQITARHLPQIRSCDLPPGRYLWVPDERARPDGTRLNEYGGAFWELAWLQRVSHTRYAAACKMGAKGLAYESRNTELSVLVDFLRAHKLEA
jgi:hypothetical protein